MIDYTTTTHTTSKTHDEGLRQFMLKVYNLMAVALLLTGSTAIITISWTPLVNLMFNTTFGSIVAFAPLTIAHISSLASLNYLFNRHKSYSGYTQF